MKRRFCKTLVGFRVVVLTLLLASTIASAQVQVTLSSNIANQTHQLAHTSERCALGRRRVF